MADKEPYFTQVRRLEDAEMKPVGWMIRSESTGWSGLYLGRLAPEKSHLSSWCPKDATLHPVYAGAGIPKPSAEEVMEAYGPMGPFPGAKRGEGGHG